MSNIDEKRIDEELDKFHWHEGLDRSSMFLEIFATWVAEHPTIARDPTLTRMADEAIDKIRDLYVAVAERCPPKGAKEKK